MTSITTSLIRQPYMWFESIIKPRRKINNEEPNVVSIPRKGSRFFNLNPEYLYHDMMSTFYTNLLQVPQLQDSDFHFVAASKHLYFSRTTSGPEHPH